MKILNGNPILNDMEQKVKIMRTATIALSLSVLLRGQLKFLNKYFDVIAVSGQDDHLESVKSREGVEIREVKMFRQILPFRDLVSLIKMYLLFRKEKPTIVHSITPKAGLTSMCAAYFAGVPIRIHTFTGLFWPTQKGLFRRVLMLLDKLLCAFATHIIPEGEGVKNDLANYNITKKELKILANGNVNGVDLKHYNNNQVNPDVAAKLRTQLNITASDFIFIFIGRIVKDKGISELINAFEDLQENHKLQNIKLLLVGPLEPHLDPLPNDILNCIQDNPSILSAGFQSDIRPFLSISDCLVLPSYREGFPNVVLQAGAHELPCIVTNVNGSNEIISNGYNGIVVDPKSIEGLVHAMKLYLSDSKFKTEHGRNARKNVEEKFDQKIVWKATKSFYDTAINEL